MMRLSTIMISLLFAANCSAQTQATTEATDSVGRIAITVVTKTGSPIETVLPEYQSDEHGPMIYPSEKRLQLVSPHRSILFSRIKEIKFHATKIALPTGIKTIHNDNDHATTFTVYSISGKLIGTGLKHMPALPKGIYIVNGQKLIIK